MFATVATPYSPSGYPPVCPRHFTEVESGEKPSNLTVFATGSRSCLMVLGFVNTGTILAITNQVNLQVHALTDSIFLEHLLKYPF